MATVVDDSAKIPFSFFSDVSTASLLRFFNILSFVLAAPTSDTSMNKAAVIWYFNF